ncbi:MAG: hypothetical protein IKM25_05630 [Clostridia bacterium]|nr:hypothetical protein [Clostridia bacterium]
MNIAEKIKEITDRISDKTRLSKKLMLVLVLFAAGLVALLFSELGQSREEKIPQETTTLQKATAQEYVQSLEERITSIISSIDGAGSTRVMITLESGSEDVYLHNYDYGEDVDEDGAGNREVKNEYVVVDNSGEENGIVIRVEEPKIRGVAVVCEGGGNDYVKAQIISTVTALLDISSARVSVAKMN